MEFFGNAFMAEIIARIFQRADKEVRQEIINPHNPLIFNERERVATLCSMIRNAVRKIPFIRSFSMQAHAADTTRGDALFVFRYREEVKVGIVEAKILRIKNSELSNIWDWSNKGESHFTNQVIKQQSWLKEAAVWDMFIPNCSIRDYSPSLVGEGSSNIWADELHKSPLISTPQRLWSYKDVLDEKEQYLSLYQIIKEILLCSQGKKHDVTGKSEIDIISSKEKKITVPIPRSSSLSGRVIENFFRQNETTDSLNYFRFDDVFESVKDYAKTKEIIIPENIKMKKSYNLESLNEYSSIVKASFLEQE